MKIKELITCLSKLKKCPRCKNELTNYNDVGVLRCNNSINNEYYSHFWLRDNYESKSSSTLMQIYFNNYLFVIEKENIQILKKEKLIFEQFIDVNQFTVVDLLYCYKKAKLIEELS